ncbi:MAG: hypothetical protein KFB96_00630 [Thiocapsa sp.]|uniref:hypothetical protein n=1 Tax=Thiocapsa sp. TaxID=2024551 RepID=UPI001BCF1EAA|nr:hypothetical protein [Thiocapsa sp.]QVL49081.1 MAG: hypothetical protein KFB96_00630 [Thiocapsa sp.]
MVSTNTPLIAALNNIESKIDQVMAQQMQFATTLISHADKLDTIRGDVYRIDAELNHVRVRLAALELEPLTLEQRMPTLFATLGLSSSSTPPHSSQ